MLTEAQGIWLTEISPENLSAMFDDQRKEILTSLNSGNPDYENGRRIQDEVAALHRLEKRFLNLRCQVAQAK